MVRKYKRKKGTSISKAKKYTYKGVEYKSGLEKYMAQVLSENGILFQYEPTKFEVQPKFKFETESYERQANGKGEFKNRGEKAVLPITYTPDFIGEGFIIETKGYANESFPMKWKMFKFMVHNELMNVVLYKPQNRKECDETVKLILKKNE
jgi:hypothetical protein